MGNHSVVWSDTAKDALLAIYRHLRANSAKSNAKKVLNAIHSKAATLVDFPYVGKIDPWFADKGKGHRYILSSRYRIVYRIQDQNVIFTNVFDGRMDPDLYFVTGER